MPVTCLGPTLNNYQSRSEPSYEAAAQQLNYLCHWPTHLSSLATPSSPSARVPLLPFPNFLAALWFILQFPLITLLLTSLLIYVFIVVVCAVKSFICELFSQTILYMSPIKPDTSRTGSAKSKIPQHRILWKCFVVTVSERALTLKNTMSALR